MNTTYRGPNFTIDFEATDLKEAFAFLGRCDEVFSGCGVCENCKGADIRPKYRNTKGGYEYYSMECAKCKWEFKFGQTKAGQLYPKGWEAGYQSEHDQTAPQSAGNGKQELDRQSPF